MGKQSIIDKSELTNFLDCGAILQMDPDQFKLIWGPFRAGTLGLDLSLDEKTIIYSPDFWDFLIEKPSQQKVVIGAKEQLLDRQQIVAFLNQLDQVESSLDRSDKTAGCANIKWQQVEESEFIQQFQWSQAQFQQQKLVKTVPIVSQVGVVDFSKKNIAQVLTSILKEQHYGSTFGFWENAKGYLGHTPELVFDWSSQSHELVTMALAGTMVNTEDNRVQILKDQKIKDEHQIVVTDLSEALNEVLHLQDKNKKMDIEETKILRLKFLLHLQTMIKVYPVLPSEVLNYLKGIHPTAALGIYPRKRAAYKYFKSFQVQKKRKNFAAPFVFLDKNRIKAVAAIRLIYFQQDSVEIISGCGVTAGSVLQDELHELNHKRNSVKKMMGLNL